MNIHNSLLGVVVLSAAVTLLALAPCVVRADESVVMGLSHDFAERNDTSIQRHQKSGDRAIRMYAADLNALVNSDFAKVRSLGTKCLSSEPITDEDAFAYVSCGLATAAGMGTTHRLTDLREYYLWMSRVIAYYKLYKPMIDAASGNINLNGILNIRVPTKNAIIHWPTQVSHVKSDWKTITLHKGSMMGRIDGKRIPFVIDTGSADINISNTQIRKYGLKNDLIPLNAGSRAGTYTSSSPIRLYYARRFTLGPISIANVYVRVSAIQKPAVGLNVLRMLGSFTLSANAIHHAKPPEPRFCGRMRRSRYELGHAGSRLFVIVPTGAGALGLWLDSGLHGGDVVQHFDVMVRQTVAKALTTKYHLSYHKKFTVDVTMAGVSKRTETIPFSFYVGRMRMLALSYELPSSDPELSGVIIFPFLRRASVFYDFHNQTMCLGLPH